MQTWPRLPNPNRSAVLTMIAAWRGGLGPGAYRHHLDESEKAMTQRRTRLSEKQRRFVREYLQDCNATQAAIRAGYSPKSANVNGPRMLVNAGVAAEISRQQAEKVKQLDISADRVLKEVARIAFSDMRDYVEVTAKGVRAKPMDELTDDQAAAVAEVRDVIVGKRRTTRIKLHDKLAALEKLSRHLGLYREEVVTTPPQGLLDKALEDIQRNGIPPILAALLQKRARQRGLLTDGGCADDAERCGQ